MAKRYYWLQLKEEFFKEKEIKKLRKIAGGDTYTIIYLKMLLLAMNQNNKLYFDGIEENFSAELALELDEDEENVSIAIEYLKAKNLLEVINEEEFLLTRCAEMVSSECDSAARVRRYRERKALPCNNDVTPSNEIVTKCNREKEREKEKDIDKDIKRERINYQKIIDMYNTTCVSYPEVCSLSESRKKAIKARLKKYSLEDLKKVFELAEASDFMKGANNRNWTADFDWIMKDANIAKILEGKYTNKEVKNNANRVRPNINRNEKPNKEPEVELPFDGF